MRSLVTAPVHVSVIGHGFVNETIQSRVVFSEGLARVDGVSGVGRRWIPAARIKVSEHSFGPVIEAIMTVGSASPFAGACSVLEKLLELFIELNVESLHAEFILL